MIFLIVIFKKDTEKDSALIELVKFTSSIDVIIHVKGNLK